MKNIISLSKKLLAVLLAVSALCFTSCIEEDNSDDELVLTSAALNGVYKSQSGDGYTIIYPIIKYDDGGYNMEFSGTIVYTDFLTNRIVYQVTKAGSANTSQPVGKFCVTRFKGLSSTSCKFSNAFKLGKPMYKDSVTEAVNEFTDENGYFGVFGEYARNYDF